MCACWAGENESHLIDVSQIETAENAEKKACSAEPRFHCVPLSGCLNSARASIVAIRLMQTETDMRQRLAGYADVAGKAFALVGDKQCAQ